MKTRFVSSLLAIILLVFALTGCGSQKQEIASLQSRVAELEAELEQRDEAIADWEALYDSVLQYNILVAEKPFEHGIIKADTPLRMVPSEEAEPIRYSDTYYVPVLAALYEMRTQEMQLWLLVNIPAWDTPEDTIGWVRSENVYAYTEETKYDICGPVYLKEGAKLSADWDKPGMEFDEELTEDYLSAPPFYIARVEEDYTLVGSKGGWDARVDPKYIVYPPVD